MVLSRSAAASLAPIPGAAEDAVVLGRDLDGDGKIEVVFTTTQTQPDGSQVFVYAADGKLYVMNFDADVSVVQTGGPDFKVLHKANFRDDGDDTRHRSSIAISQGNLFIRTGTKLHCVGR